MSKRKITNPLNVKFEPFDSYGAPVSGMSWHKISYNKKTGQGSYILKMEPDAKSLPHKHISYEEFLMLDGELIDPDNKVFKTETSGATGELFMFLFIFALDFLVILVLSS